MSKQYFYGEVNYTPLVQVRDTLDRVLQSAQNEAEKMGVVQAFEIAYELSWRILKKILKFRGVDTSAARDVFRESAKLKLLTDAEQWFAYLKKRNITVHAYRKEILDELFANTAKEFLTDLDYLLNQLEKQAPDYDSTRK